MDCQWCWKVEVKGASVFHGGMIGLFHLLSELKILIKTVRKHWSHNDWGLLCHWSI